MMLPSNFIATVVLCALMAQSAIATATAVSVIESVSSSDPSVLSLNISYLQATSVFGDHHRRAYSTVQLPSVNGPSKPDEIYIMGGVDAFDESMWPTVYNDTWKSLDEGNSWTRVASFPPRFAAAACVTPDLNILVIGGAVGYPNFTAATDSYMSRNRGITWVQSSTKQPFQTGDPHCTIDGTGKYVFVWVGDIQFRPGYTQLYRAPYTGNGIGEWVGFATPAADGKSLLDRIGYAIIFLPHSNQLVIGGGSKTSIQPAVIVKEVLSLTLPLTDTQNVSAWTRTVITAEWPSSDYNNNYFALDSRQNLYLFTSSDANDNVENSLWRSGSTTSFDSWIPIDQNSSCGVTWNPLWVSVSKMLTSSAGGTDRFLFIDEDLMLPTLMIPLDTLNRQSGAIIANETFAPVTVCLPPDEPSNNHIKWQIIVVIGVASSLVIACATYFICARRKPAEAGVNSPLLNTV